MIAATVRRGAVGFDRLSGVLVLAATAAPATGMTISGYTPAANDRFSGGFALNPVANASPAFVGTGLDWSGVGWATSAPTKGFGFLSPSHYLVARHYGGAARITLALNGGTASAVESTVESTPYGLVFEGQTYGDLSLGTLAAPVATTNALPRYAVLDLNDSSSANTPAHYNDLDILAYGRGPDGNLSPRVGTATTNGAEVTGYWSILITNRADVQLESGDSGSPTFAKWTNPNGSSELTILGNNAGIDTVNQVNGFNFLGTHEVIAALNSLMNDDGRALRVAGNASAIWGGTDSTAIGDAAAWSGGSVPTDRFVLFNAATAGTNQTVTVTSDHDLRGLFFKASAAPGDGFAFSGSNSLTIGRGGITNYDTDRQVLNAPIVLGSSQYWDGGNGGISTNTIDTDGHLLEITGSGTSRVDGAITGAGGLALSGGSLVLAGSNTYSGRTWVHGGQLIVDGTTAATSAVTVERGATLQGIGTIGGATTLESGGTISPGNSPGQLTLGASVTWLAGGNYNWQILSAIGTAGTAWDLLDIHGNLNLTALSSANPFNLNLWSLASSGPDLNGDVPDFNSTQGHSWMIASAAGGISGFNADKFNIQVTAANGTGGFSNGLSGGEFTLVQQGNLLNLVFSPAAIPEPASSLATAGLLASGLLLRRRTKPAG